MNKVLIIGSGPAGMSCAHYLGQKNQTSLVISKEEIPGGMCRTINFNGYLFDIGGHRFISKSKEVNDLWQDFMQDDMLHVKRLSRIHYRKRYFSYPLSFMNTFWNLGFIESILCVASYLRYIKTRPFDDKTFEGWIKNRFGKRLYNIFFKTYTEKVWEVACKDISADWAQQRIRGLSLRVALQDALWGKKNNSPKTLCEEFLYPRNGPGEFYRRLSDKIVSLGSSFNFGKDVICVKHQDNKVTSIITQDIQSSRKEELSTEYLFSSMPLPRLIEILEPKPPEEILQVAKKLKLRSFLVVNVILEKEHIFPDQWLYIHEPDVKMGRIQNYKNWSPGMVEDSKNTSLGLEYFCNEFDDFWKMNNVDLIRFALEELERIGIASRKSLLNGFVVRQPNAYPVYSLDYKENVDLLKNYLHKFSNLQSIGRAGLFRYDNSDHALLTGIYAAKNFFNEGSFDLWKANDEGYFES